MTPRFSYCGRALVAASLLICTGAVAPAWGQKKPAPPAPSGAPTLAFPTPLGAQRGVPLEVTLTGTNLAGAVQLLTEFPAKATVEADPKAADTRVKVRLEVPADAPLGAYPLRLATTGGLSNLRLFA